MSILAVALLAVLPPLVIMAFIYRKDRIEPEPLPLVIWTMLLGGLMGLPAAAIEGVAGPLFGHPQDGLAE